MSEGFTEPCPRSPWRSAAGAESSFCKRPEIVNIFVFVDWIVCVVTAQICHGRAEVATGSTEMNRRRCVPAKRHLPKQAAGQIGPTGGHSQNPGLDSALASEGNSLTGTRASCLLSPWAPHRWAGALPERSVCTQRHTLHDWHVPDAGPAARTQDGSASEAMTFLQVLSLVSQAGPAPSLPAPNAGEGPVMGSGTPGRVTKSPPPGASLLHWF